MDKEVGLAIQTLKSSPKLRQMVLDDVEEIQAGNEDDGQERGRIGQERSRMFLKEYKRKIANEEKEIFDQMLKSEPCAYVFTNTNKFLSGHWTEIPTAYKVMSKIDPSQESRVKGVINSSRYSSKCVDV